MRRTRSTIVLAVSALSLLALATGAAYGQGEELWTARHNGSANAHDSAKAVVTDADGNVFVTGFEAAIGTGEDAVTRKYDSDGNLLWENRRAVVLNQIGWDIAVDSNGDAYVADSRFTVLKYDGAKYDADGNELWTNRYDNGVGDDIPKGLTATADRVYIAGLSRGTGTFYDYVTLALSNS